MSFKRDSDNKAWHEEIRKRRVSELLCEDIPEDEASLLRNGRFTCLVCSHRPVFDTLDVLSLHRSSKKHKFHLENFMAKKRELEDLKRKRYAQQMNEAGHSSSIIPETSSSSLQNKLHHPVYNACTKRPKLKPHQRKARLDLDLKTGLDGEEASISNDTNGQNKSKKRCKAEIPVKTVDIDTLKEKLLIKATEAKPETEPSKETKQYVNLKMNRLMNETKGKGKKPSTVIGPQVMPPPKEEKMEYVKQFLTAVGSGWKKDRSGQWVKDEDAEFDSDEEAPDIPLPGKSINKDL